MVTWLLVALVLAFLWLLVRGSLWSARPQEAASLALGEATLGQQNGAKYWLQRTPQMSEIEALNDYVIVGEACHPLWTYCRIDARTQMAGVMLLYQQQRPTTLPADMPWFGGYVDPSNGGVYDRLGRSYRLPSGRAPLLRVTESELETAPR